MGKVQVRNKKNEILGLPLMKSNGKIVMKYILGRGAAVVNEEELLPDAALKVEQRIIELKKLR